MPAGEWADAEVALRYLEQQDEFPHRTEGERVLLEHLPLETGSILDLGTGDGRLLNLVKADRPLAKGVALDDSEVMLERARERFEDRDDIELIRHDMAEPLPDLGTFGAVVSSFAIHHLEHERKQALYREVFELLEAGGVFANLEHVASPSEKLHLAFFEAIGEPIENEDPSDRTTDVHSQLAWLGEAGFVDVDCHWKWLEMALLVGVRPA